MEEQGVKELFSISWLTKLFERVCTIHWAVGITCIVSLLVYSIFWDADQSAKSQFNFDQEMKRRHQDELERDAAHKRFMELLEALKPRRDLTQPAEADEGF
jgi:hypothetical protein